MLGAGLALLFAPQSGQEVRRKLAARGAAAREVAAGSQPPSSTDVLLGSLAAAQERIERAIVEARVAARDSRRELTAEWEERRAGPR
jgi:gas vesicle protein